MDQGTSLDALPQPSTFTWTPSKATAFDADNLPLAKVPRGWERKALQSKGDNGKTKTVWKRYGLRKQPGTASTHAGEKAALEGLETMSPVKIVKKARVVSPVKSDSHQTTTMRTRQKSTATRYERRKSTNKRMYSWCSFRNCYLTPL